MMLHHPRLCVLLLSDLTHSVSGVHLATRSSLACELIIVGTVAASSVDILAMSTYPSLQKIDDLKSHQFTKPVKRIHDGSDVSFFLTSLAYRDIMAFILQLNRSVLPRKRGDAESASIQTWPLNSPEITSSDPIKRLCTLLEKLDRLVDDVPPDTGPRRFGNISFRKWYQLAEEQTSDLLKGCLPAGFAPGFEELEAYLLGSFGSPQRLDYGTGHELSFLAFLGCLWKLNFFANAAPGVEERAIVLGVFEPYLLLVRRLIKTYTLEPAGSHGVWGLDDNSFLPYVFGSAQLSPAIAESDETPVEGSLPDAPEPSAVTKVNIVEKEKTRNMYFSAIAFIYDVKRGPFWEHSRMLFDISGIKDGWGKINKGMIKMYNAEVLSKFPVVQHFPFGSLFRWEQDPEAKAPPASTHTTNQPLRNPLDSHASPRMRPGVPPFSAGTSAPWAARPAQPPVGFVNGVTQAPWTSRTPMAPPARGGFSSRLRPTRPVLSESAKESDDQEKT